MNRPQEPQTHIVLHFKSSDRGTCYWEDLLEMYQEIKDKYPDVKDDEISLDHHSEYDSDVFSLDHHSEYDSDVFVLEFHRRVENPNYGIEMRRYSLLKQKYEAFQKEVAELAKQYSNDPTT